MPLGVLYTYLDGVHQIGALVSCADGLRRKFRAVANPKDGALVAMHRLMWITGVGKDVHPLTQSDLRELIAGDIDAQCHVREVGDAIKGLPRCSHLVGADVAGHHGSTRGVHDVASAQSVVHLLHLHGQGAGFFVDAVG